jgi:hypothetical protein
MQGIVRESCLRPSHGIILLEFLLQDLDCYREARLLMDSLESIM